MSYIDGVKIHLTIFCKWISICIWLTIIASFEVNSTTVSISLSKINCVTKFTIVVDLQDTSRYLSIKTELRVNSPLSVNVVIYKWTLILWFNLHEESSRIWSKNFNEGANVSVKYLHDADVLRNICKVSDSLCNVHSVS